MPADGNVEYPIYGGCDIVAWKSFVVDGEKFKPDTWYTLKDGNVVEADGTVLHRIRALRGILSHNVKAGACGGWIESECNLSQNGDCSVRDNAEVCGYAWVYDNAEIARSSDYMTVKNAWSSNSVFTYTRSNRKWKVGCFYGTGEELIAKAYKDGELSGKCYEATVK